MTAMTAVETTRKALHFQTRRVEIWSARSTDGLWTYEREESPGTPWVVTHVPTGALDMFASLPKARRFTARPDAAAWFARIAEETA